MRKLTLTYDCDQGTLAAEAENVTMIDIPDIIRALIKEMAILLTIEEKAFSSISVGKKETEN